MKVDKKFPVMIYAGISFSLLLVIFLGSISLYFSENQKQNEQRVNQAYQVLEQIHVVHQHLYEMEMYKQEYRITGVDSFYPYYHIQSDSLLKGLTLLNTLVADSRPQVNNINVLKQQIAGLLTFWQLKKTNLLNSNAKAVLGVTWTEKAKMDSIKLQIADISSVEHKVLKQQEESDRVLRGKTEFSIIAGTTLILTLVSLLIYFILKELKNRLSAYQKGQEMNRLKSNFISLASHEFRTPLSSILLSTSLIEKYIKAHDTANVAKHSQKIKATVGNMNNILEDFLSMEKLNAGKVNPVCRPFDIVDLCEDITEEMQQIAKAGQNISFEHTGANNIVNLDRNLIRSAIINLVANSVKYAGDSAAIVLKTDISADRVTISIKDNGIGIAENEQKDLFTPFYRISNTGNIPGTGLGLSIVLQYVNLMKGKLSFSSVPNKETCFQMFFNLTS